MEFDMEAMEEALVAMVVPNDHCTWRWLPLILPEAKLKGVHIMQEAIISSPLHR